MNNKNDQKMKNQPSNDPVSSSKKNSQETGERSNIFIEGMMLPPRVVMQIADEVAKVVSARMAHGNSNNAKKKKKVFVIKKMTVSL